jgi:hypothetical protein
VVPEAFVGAEPVYVTLKPEIVETIGERMYEALAAELDKRLLAQKRKS